MEKATLRHSLLAIRPLSMITGLDHIILLANDLGTAVRAYETLLGQTPAWRASGDGVETAIFTLVNMSLEIMAPVR
jgi:hypothetical protein